jgi:hypothetical protein
MPRTMLDTLIALTKTGEFEDSGGFRFGLAQSTAEGMALELILVPGDGADEQHWRVDCFGVREHLLRGEFSGLQIVSEHPVLLPFTEQVTDLYFYSASPNPMATVGALFERHRDLVGSWIPFERFLNVVTKGLSPLLAASSGQLASGPVSLMEAYSSVLGEYGVRSSMLPSRPPKFWDGEKWLVSSIPLRALVFESSYVVAERFDAQKLLA